MAEKEFYMKKEKAHWAGIFFPWLPETQEYTVKNISLMWTQWGKGRAWWETSIGIHTLSPVQSCCIHRTLCSVMTSIGGMGMAGRRIQREGDICIHIVEPLCCTAET